MSRSLGDVWLKGMRRLVKKQQTQVAKAAWSLWTPPPAGRAKRAKPVVERSASPLAAVTARWLPAVARSVAVPAPAPAPRRRATPVEPAPRARATVAPHTSVRSAAVPQPRARAPQLFPIPVRGRWTRGVFEPAAADAAGGAAQRNLHYWLYWPSGAPASPRPLVVMLHGCGQTATEFAQGTRMNELAQRKGFAVLYPQQSVTAEASRCWPWYSAQNQRGGGDAQAIRDLVRAVLDEHPVDRSRVYVAGISAGAAMAQILALTNPEMIAAVGMHSGPVYGCAESRPVAFSVMQHGAALQLERALRPLLEMSGGPLVMPAMLIHGEGDKVVRPVNLMQVARQFVLLNGLKGEAAKPLLRAWPARVRGREPRNAYRTLSYLVSGKPRLVVCQVSDLEHAWSGGVGGLRYNSATGPDASAMLWNFFSRHRRAEVWPRRRGTKPA